MGAADPNQTKVIAFLSDPGSYTPAPGSVERIDTHGAIIFLAGDKAYKIKRQVKLAYLDFSTLGKRQKTCQREVEINRKTAPDLYLGVIPITCQDNGSLQFGGEGEPVEWAVEMERFEQKNLFDVMATEDRLPLELMAPLAAHIHDYHDNAPPDPANDGTSKPEQVVASIVDALSFAAASLNQQAVGAFSDRLQSTLETMAPLLSRRAAAGYVRRCHGDLHLRNIVLLDGKPTLFDAIEFDEELATIDVLYDLAFLLMDLWHRGKRRHANTVLNRYFWRNGDPENLSGLAALPLFLSMRAGVRAMVCVDRLKVTELAAMPETNEELISYFRLAQDFLNPAGPRLVAVGGLSGTGKSTLAAAIAPLFGSAPGALHLRSDVERKLLFGTEPEEPLGANAYEPDVTARVYNTMYEKAELALAAGHPVIMDAVFAQEDQRADAERVAIAAGVPFDGLWLTAPKQVMIARVDTRTHDASDADSEVVKQQLSYDIGDLQWRVLDAGGESGETRDVAAKELGISAENCRG
jgi:aminoglycoside phosphotransferase family enzyme